MFDIFNAKTGKHYLVTDSEEFAKAIANEHMFRKFHTDYAPIDWREQDNQVGEGFFKSPEPELFDKQADYIRNLIMSNP